MSLSIALQDMARRAASAFPVMGLATEVRDLDQLKTADSRIFDRVPTPSRPTHNQRSA